MEFSRQEYWSGLPFPSPGDLPNPGMELGSPALYADSLPSEPPGKPNIPKHQAQLVKKKFQGTNDLHFIQSTREHKKGKVLNLLYEAGITQIPKQGKDRIRGFYYAIYT